MVMQDIGEFRTSVTCYACHARLVSMRARTTKMKKVGEEYVGVTSEHPVSVHKVLHCSNSVKPGAVGSGCLRLPPTGGSLS